jgi:hypothetical protein
MSGAGKTTIAAVFARLGLTVIDADGDPFLARHVDSVGNVTGDPAVPDSAWLARHSWAWNPARLDELIGVLGRLASRDEGFKYPGGPVLPIAGGGRPGKPRPAAACCDFYGTT